MLVITLAEIKIGILGCGNIATVHVRRLSTIKDVKIVAFTDIIKEKAEIMSKEYGGNVYDNWHEMLDKEHIDLLYICLPPFAHKDEVMVAAERGIHIFIEKPIALNLDLAKKMVKAVEKHGVISQVGYNCRFGCGIEEAKRLIESGEAGDVGLAVGWYWCHYIGGAWWRDKKRSGGQIVEQATHLYDAMRYLCGDVDVVYGFNNRLFWTDVPDLTIEDVSSCTFKFKSGALGAIVSTTWGIPSQWWLKWLIATKNYTMESSDVNTLTLYTTTTPVKLKKISENRDTYLLEAMNLIQAIKEGKETRTPISEGAKTLEFTLAAMKSMETGELVKLPLMLM